MTFKPYSSRSKALRALSKQENPESLISQVDGKWGFYVNDDGTPHIPEATPEAPVETRMVDEDEVAEQMSMLPPTTPVSAFAAFAASQLSGETNSVTKAAQAAAPEPKDDATSVPRKTSVSGLRIEKNRPTQNGVTRYSAGSVGAKLFDLYDDVGFDCTLQQARAVAEVHGLNKTSAAIAYYQWRRFHGIGQQKAAA